MKTTFALTLAGTLLAAGAFAQSDIIIKQHAKDIRDRNNAAQGVTPPSAPAQPVRPAASTASPTPIQQSLAKVRADLAAIQPGGTVTVEQKHQLAQDLLATAQGASKPAAATVATLADQLSATLAQKPLPEKDRNRLLTDLAAVLNPANIQQSQMQAIFKDVQAIFQYNGVAAEDAAKITDAVKAIAAEARH